VHKDFPFQSDQNATLILAGFGPGAAADSNPYKNSKTQAGFVSYGVPMFIDWVSRVTTCAMEAGWYHKWLVHRRLRPEEFGGRVHNRIVNKADFPVSERLFHSDVLNQIYNAQGTYLLSQSYPEGCPLHPSYPAVHATIAGACATVLKALFDESFVIPNPVIPNPSGESLEPYNGEPLTIGGELNKLAANIALSRDAAGVHYRSDSLNGLRLGEAVAMSLMRDLLSITADNQLPLQFHNFSGELVTIRPFGY
jgi:membrane-associated phospholipid phosphatase